MPEIEPRLGACKASALPSVLWFRPGLTGLIVAFPTEEGDFDGRVLDFL